MSRYYIITGPGCCGTHWAALTLSQFDEVKVRHDWLSLIDLREHLQQLPKIDSPIVVVSSNLARYSIPQIHSALEPRWAFLWRDPLELVKSYAARAIAANERGRFALLPPDLILLNIAQDLFSSLEIALRTLEWMRIPVSHFHLKGITTPEGFQELAEWVGVTSERFVLPPASNETPPKQKIAWTNFDDDKTREMVMAYWTMLPLVREGYQRAYAPTSAEE